MRKDKSIIDLVEKIKSRFEPRCFEIVDFWDGDLCSIGLQKENKLIYISTYSYFNQKEMKYDFDLELFDSSDGTRDKMLKEGRAVNENEMFAELKLFFKI